MSTDLIIKLGKEFDLKYNEEKPAQEININSLVNKLISNLENISLKTNKAITEFKNHGIYTFTNNKGKYSEEVIWEMENYIKLYRKLEKEVNSIY
jgi:hypothetical protein